VNFMPRNASATSAWKPLVALTLVLYCMHSALGQGAPEPPYEVNAEKKAFTEFQRSSLHHSVPVQSGFVSTRVACKTTFFNAFNQGFTACKAQSGDDERERPEFDKAAVLETLKQHIEAKAAALKLKLLTSPPPQPSAPEPPAAAWLPFNASSVDENPQDDGKPITVFAGAHFGPWQGKPMCKTQISGFYSHSHVCNGECKAGLTTCTSCDEKGLHPHLVIWHGEARAGQCVEPPDTTSKITCTALGINAHASFSPEKRDIICVKRHLALDNVQISALDRQGPAWGNLSSMGSGFRGQAVAQCQVIKHTSCADSSCRQKKYITCKKVCRAVECDGKCYYRVGAGTNNRAGCASKTEWTRDEWGEQHQNAGKSAASCQLRKPKMDHHCGTASEFTFRPNHCRLPGRGSQGEALFDPVSCNEEFCKSWGELLCHMVAMNS